MYRYTSVIMQCIVFIVCYVSEVSTYESITDPPASKTNYSIYNLEDYCNNEKEKYDFHIDSWKGAIFQVGYLFNSDGSPQSRKIHRCRVNIKTKSDFWLAAAIEYMKVRGNRDTSNKWKCSDYVQFTSPGRNLFGKLFSGLDIDLFNDKKSEKLCGKKQLDNEHLDRILDLSTDANSFSTASNKMTFIFHQDNDEKHTLNNIFKIVVTTFRHASEQVECQEKQKCYGGRRRIYCIDKAFICDGHVNCAFPGSGTDEKLCEGDKKPKIFNMTSIIIIALTSIVSLGIVICSISTVICRMRARLNNGRRTSGPASANVPLSHYPSAPGFEPEATLPPYETVILSDPLGDKDALGLGEGELPPKYESLFPEEPPLPPPFKENPGGNPSE